MNRISGRALLVTALLLSACSGVPDIAILSPAPGSALGPADDLDPVAPGLQINIDATTSAVDDSDAVASGGGAPVHATVHSGHLHFANVTLVDGATSVTVTVVDRKSDKRGRSVANYAVDSFDHGCRITTPANATTFSGAPGDSSLVSVVVEATCRGLAPGVQVGLLENDDHARTQLQYPGADGSVRFSAALIPGSNLLAVVAPGVPYDVVEVTLASSLCRVELAPPSGATFNLAGNAGAIADLDSATPGIQADLSLRTDCADGSPAQLVLSRDATTLTTASGTVSGGVASFAVTLPDGAFDAQGVVGSSSSASSSRQATYASDSLEATALILSPRTGALLGAQDSVGTGSAFVALVRGEVDVLGAGGFAALEIDQGTDQAQEVLVSPNATSGFFAADVPLNPGLHKMFLKAQRASGNTTIGSTINFNVVTNATALAISWPANGATLGSSQVTFAQGLAQLSIGIESTGLAGADVSITCGSGISASGTIGATGAASLAISLPVISCAGALYMCTASANSGAISSAPSTFTIDPFAPKATITAPLSGETASSTVALHATTNCSGEAQLFTVDNGGSIVGSGSVQNNAVDLSSVPLNVGLNALHVTVLDAAQNSSTTEVDVIRLDGAPAIVITSPAPGTLQSATTDVTVQLDNRPVGSAVQLFVSNAAGARQPVTANTVAISGHNVATFAGVVLPEGADTITASVTDPVTPVQPSATASIDVTVDTGHALCDVVTPADGISWTGADDSNASIPGFQHGMKVSTNATGKVSLTIAQAGGASITLNDNIGGDGSARSVTFADVTLSNDGTYNISATCAGTTSGQSLTNTITYAANGPAVSFVSPLDGATLAVSNFDVNGNTTVQLSAPGAGAGGEITLSADCGSGPTTYGPTTIVSGSVSFQIPLLADGQDGSCTLTAQAQTASGDKGILASINVIVARLAPSPSFIAPTSGESLQANSALLDCTTPSAPALKQIQVSLSGDVVDASGLSMVLNGSQAISQTPTFASGAWIWASVPIVVGSNTLALTATDPAGNSAQASVTFSATCALPTIAFVSPVDGATLPASAFDSHGNTSVQVSSNAGAGGTISLSATCGGATVDYGPSAIVSGSVTFQIPLLAASQNGSCTLSAQAQNSFGVSSATSLITVNVARLFPAPSFTAPTSGQTLTINSSQLNCGTPSSPVLGQVQASVGTDTLLASGLALAVNSSAVSQTPTFANGLWTWSNVAIAPGTDTLALTATDPAGNSAQTSVTFSASCARPSISFVSPVNSGTVLANAFDSNGKTSIQLSSDAGSGGTISLTTNCGNGTSSYGPAVISSGGATFQVALGVASQDVSCSLSAQSKNSLGVTSLTSTITVSVDRLAPVPVFTSPTSGVALTAASATLDCTTPSAPVLKQVQASVGADTVVAAGLALTLNGTTVAKTPTVASGVWSWTNLPLSTSTDSNTLALTATDAPGNQASTSVTFSASCTRPSITFVSPTTGASIGSSAFDGNGNTSIQLSSNAVGGTISLSANCGGATTNYGPTSIVSGGVTFQIPLGTASQNSTCTLNAFSTTTTSVNSNNASITISVDRLPPAPSFTAPTSGQAFTPASPQLSCTVPSTPTLSQVQISTGAVTVLASGLALTVNGAAVSQTPTFANGVWTWTNVALAANSNTLGVTATDAAGNQGSSSVTFTARCASLNVALIFNATGNQFGYDDDQDHSTTGVQVGATVQATAPTGSPVRICSTIASGTPGGCTTPGTGALTIVSGSNTIQVPSGTTGFAQFTVTIPNGPQTVYAEVTNEGVDATPSLALVARDTPPTVKSIALAEDTQGQTLVSGSDGALNQTEIDAANGTVNFRVVFGTNSYVTGQTVKILSTASSTVLGSATATQNGDGSTITNVPVALAQLNPGGYQSYVFYASVVDDAANPVSTPNKTEAGVAPTTLGTSAVPFVIAPTPTVALTAPVLGTTNLNASNDVRCSGGVCPGTDPLFYNLAATTNAPDHSLANVSLTSAITFFEFGSAITPTPGLGEKNPTTTSGGLATVELPIANAISATLSAKIADPYGNVATSAALTARVDTVSPALSITQINGTSTSSTVTISTLSTTALVSIAGAGPLESGQTITITDVGTQAVVGSAVADGSTSASVTIVIPSGGAHTLVATATDVAGNKGTSATVRLTQNYAGPSLAISSPPIVGSTLWFGFNTPGDTNASISCTPTLSFTTTNVPNGRNVSAWTVASNASCGASIPGGAATGAVASHNATITQAFTLANGSAGKLCAEVDDGAGNVSQVAQAYQCDLATPTVAWVSPTLNQLFVANGQTQISSATPSTTSSTTQLGLSAARLRVYAPTGGTLTLSVNQNSSTTAQFVSCAVAATGASAIDIYATGAATCSTSSAVGQLLLPIDYAQALAHTLTASFSAASGNSATNATQSVKIDVAEPAAATVAVGSSQSAIGVFNVTVAATPDDDQAIAGSGGAASWQVCYSTTTLDATHWCTFGAPATGTLVTANLSGSFPSGVPTSFQVVLPAGSAKLYLGVRAVDRVGNLGDVGGSSVIQLNTQPTGSTVNVIDDSSGSPSSYGPVTMRVADVDGDGYDDIILAYPFAACSSGTNCDGRIIVYFGGSGGVTNAAAPLVLLGNTGTISGGLMGLGQAFDVGDFDGDGKADIAAGETDFVSASDVVIWTGAAIAQLKSHGVHVAGPTVTLTDSSPSQLIGGTVRAVGQITGGNGIGSDLAINNFNTNDGYSGTLKVAILQRGGAWSAAGAGTTKLFSNGSPATAIITLPAVVAGVGPAATDNATVESAPFTYAGASGSLAGVAFALLNNGSTPAAHETRLFSTTQIASGGNVDWSTGTVLPAPTGVAGINSYGAYMAGGQNAVGDSHQDLLITDSSTGIQYLYDGTSLLGPSVSSEPTTATFAYGAGTPLIATGATLLPDLNGDGYAEIAGANDPAQSANIPAYVWFGGNAALPSLPFISQANGCQTTATNFCFSPGRGQELGASPVSSSAYVGQAIGSGHVTSLTGRDVVVLSKNQDTPGGAITASTLIIMR